MFGALAASPSGIVKGRGVPVSQPSFGLLVFPGVWDWYLQWREQRVQAHRSLARNRLG